MPRVGFEPTISAGERPKTYALDRAATGTGNKPINEPNSEVFGNFFLKSVSLLRGYLVLIYSRMQVLKLSRRQNSMSFSRADSPVKMSRFSDVSKTNSVPIFKCAVPSFGATKPPTHPDDGDGGVSRNFKKTSHLDAADRENLIIFKNNSSNST